MSYGSEPLRCAELMAGAGVHAQDVTTSDVDSPHICLPPTLPLPFSTQLRECSELVLWTAGLPTGQRESVSSGADCG